MWLERIPQEEANVAVVSDDQGAREPTEEHRQKLWNKLSSASVKETVCPPVGVS